MSAKKAPAAVPATLSEQNEQISEPWFALPLTDMQAIQNFLQREMISGQEATALLNKLAQAVPAQKQD